MQWTDMLEDDSDLYYSNIVGNDIEFDIGFDMPCETDSFKDLLLSSSIDLLKRFEPLDTSADAVIEIVNERPRVSVDASVDVSAHVNNMPQPAAIVFVDDEHQKLIDLSAKSSTQSSKKRKREDESNLAKYGSGDLTNGAAGSKPRSKRVEITGTTKWSLKNQITSAPNKYLRMQPEPVLQNPYLETLDHQDTDIELAIAREAFISCKVYKAAHDADEQAERDNAFMEQISIKNQEMTRNQVKKLAPIKKKIRAKYVDLEKKLPIDMRLSQNERILRGQYEYMRDNYIRL
jgi:hypothetical protein